MCYYRKKYDKKKAEKLSHARPQRLLCLYGGYYYDFEKGRYIRCSHSKIKSFAKKYFNRKNRRLTNQMLQMEKFEDLPVKKSNDIWMFD